jgi:molecular chaperone DnaJ
LAAAAAARVFRCLWRHLRRDFRRRGGGGGGGRSNIYRGADLRYNLEITLEQAAHGTETKIRIPTMEVCEPCSGSGAKAGTQPKTCPTCGGSGSGSSATGLLLHSADLPQVSRHRPLHCRPCKSCGGAGRIKQHKTLAVKIPAGVDEGDRIRLAGEGEHGVNGGPPGDLYVQIHLKAHTVFTRDHNDLHCEMPISFTTAALGGEIEIPTLDGAAAIKIPPETQTGRVFRLRGKGIKGVRSHTHGDLMCHVVVETPVNPDRSAKGTAEGTGGIQQGLRSQAQSACQVLDGQR